MTDFAILSLMAAAIFLISAAALIFAILALNKFNALTIQLDGRLSQLLKTNERAAELAGRAAERSDRMAEARADRLAEEESRSHQPPPHGGR